MPPRSDKDLDKLIKKRKDDHLAKLYKARKRRVNTANRKDAKARRKIKKAQELIDGNMLRNGAIYFELMMEADYHFPHFRKVGRHRLLMLLMYLVWAHGQDFLHYSVFFLEADIRYREDRRLLKGMHGFLIKKGLADRTLHRSGVYIYYLSSEGKELAEFLYTTLKEKYSRRVPNILDEYRYMKMRERIKYYKVAKAVRKAAIHRSSTPPMKR